LSPDDNVRPEDCQPDYRTAPNSAPLEQPAIFSGEGGRQSVDEGTRRIQLYSTDQLLVDGVPVLVYGESRKELRSTKIQSTRNVREYGGNGPVAGYGGRTDLVLLNETGMSVTLAYERNRLRRAGLGNAKIFNPALESPQAEALVFDVSSPDRIAKARLASVRFDAAMEVLTGDFEVSTDWPGFDVLTLDPVHANLIDRLIELKSSGVASRTQDMTWNEWKSARSSTLRDNFYLYLVGNLRSDLNGSKPYIRTIRNPFGQLFVEVQVNRKVDRSVHLDVYNFKEAEHLELSIRPEISVADHDRQLA
jgi:hypothetical protein